MKNPIRPKKPLKSMIELLSDSMCTSDQVHTTLTTSVRLQRPFYLMSKAGAFWMRDVVVARIQSGC